MKILTHKIQRQADEATIVAEGIGSIDLMERAAEALTSEIVRRWNTSHRILVFAGVGNNGGDALAVARMLFVKGYRVVVYLFKAKRELSENVVINADRLRKAGCQTINEIESDFTPPEIIPSDVLIDGLFGIGLNRALEGGFAKVIQFINQSPATVVAIDIPSGLMTEDNSQNTRSTILKADLTLTIHRPKLSFFFAENAEFIGEWQVVNIGIDPAFMEEVDTPYCISEHSDMAPLLRSRSTFAHKGDFGHGLLIASSAGMAGASILAARAALRSGIGKVTTHVPASNVSILQATVPEALVSIDANERIFTYPVDLDTYQTAGVGPGLGTDEVTAAALIAQLKQCYMPIVIDADALNILARHHEAWKSIPRGSILTPHQRELERWIGSCRNGYERMYKAIELAEQLSCYIVMKGAWSAVITPQGKVYFNPTGNPGMATAGSGDVLTGVLTALLAQGLESEQAARLGVFAHGLAGDIAARCKGEIGMTAGDIIEALPEAWKQLTTK